MRTSAEGLVDVICGEGSAEGGGEDGEGALGLEAAGGVEEDDVGVRVRLADADDPIE